MRDKIKKALHYIAERHGVALFSEPAKFKATLADTLGNMGVGGSEANRLRHLLNTAVGDMQAYSRLKNAFARKEYIAVAHLIAEMDRDYDVKTDSAQIVIECIAELLGYAPPAPAVREEPHPRERQQSPAPFEPSRQPSERQHPRPASPQPDSAPAQLSDADILRLAAALKNDVSLQSVIGQANPLSLASPVIARIKEVLPSIPAVFQQKPPLPAAKNSLIRETKKFAGCDWLVLDVQDGKALLLREEIWDKRPYNKTRAIAETTWENCTLRKELNTEFYNQIPRADRTRIVKTLVKNDKNLWYGTNGGRDTYDYVFLLSLDDADRYFGNSGDYVNKNRKDNGGKIEPTGFCIFNKYNQDRMATYNGSASWWWLRSPGNHSYNAVAVSDAGDISMVGGSVDSAGCGVRPALWINL